MAGMEQTGTSVGNKYDRKGYYLIIEAIEIRPRILEKI